MEAAPMPSLFTVRDLVAVLDRWFPAELAESWDNTGLLLGDPAAPVERVLTCLALTAAVADEALVGRTGLIVTHHPIFFRPIQRLVADGPSGFLFQLAARGVALYSPHTRFDGSAQGINDRLARLLGVVDPTPIRPLSADGSGSGATSLGAGRFGALAEPTTLDEFAWRAAERLGLGAIQVVGEPSRPVGRAAVACGAAGEFLEDALRLGADVFVTGELRYHDALKAESAGLALGRPGHHASERFACERLAERLAAAFPALAVRAATSERDPIRTLTGP